MFSCNLSSWAFSSDVWGSVNQDICLKTSNLRTGRMPALFVGVVWITRISSKRKFSGVSKGWDPYAMSCLLLGASHHLNVKFITWLYFLKNFRFKKYVVILLFFLSTCQWWWWYYYTKILCFDLFKILPYGDIVLYKITHMNCQQQEFHLI